MQTAREYLERIGYTGPEQPTLPVLRALVEAHMDCVPFENLDILAGVPFSLEKQDLWNKIVAGRRGGVCHELNHAFYYLLEEMGFQVTLGSARIDTADNELEHTDIRAVIDSRTYLVDVGYAPQPIPPIDLGDDAPQTGFRRCYRARPEADSTVTLLLFDQGDDEYHPMHVLYPQVRRTEDFLPIFREAAVPGATPFSSIHICSRYTGSGEYKLVKNTLTIVEGDTQEQITVQNESHRAAILMRYFGIEAPVPAAK